MSANSDTTSINPSRSFVKLQWKWASAAKIVAIVYLILFLVVLIRSMS